MKHATLLLLAALTWPSASIAQDTPVVVEKTFWVKAGKERQFAALFQRTELQRLLKEKQAGRIRWLRVTEPALAGGSAGWDLRVTVAWSGYDDMLKDAAGATERQSHASIEDMLRGDLVEEQSEVLIKETVPQPAG
ncbi:MAG TPA: hypothetical protein VFE72_02470 [Lysobacter sp.]|nr:hypothetical protein [Lysobacter sp.]